MLPDIEKDGSISNVLQQGQEVIVQIVKEPISTKGPRLTCELSFAGRYLVLIPFNDKVSVSQKIKSSEERARLKQLLQSIKPKNFGVIVRTVAEGKRVAELDAELKVLLKHWEETITKVQKATKMPTLVYEETSRTVAMLRDLFNPSYENIYVNDETVYNEVKNYVALIAPERVGIVKLYKGQLPIFDNFAITKQIKSSFGKTVSYKSGAYLIIEHTEALHVVDVNSGNRSKSANGQEANARDVNWGAADELARQKGLEPLAALLLIQRENRLDARVHAFVKGEVKDEEEALKGARQVQVAARTDETARRRYEVALRLYLMGKSTILDLNAATTEKDTARRNHIEALKTYWTLYYGLRSMTQYDFERNCPLADNLPEI